MFYGYGVEDFANEAYNKVDDRSVMVDNHQYDKDVSNPDVAVYKDPNSNKTFVAFRGTSRIDDIKPDIGIALNKYKTTDRYKASKKDLEKVIGKYGKENLHLTGHSLGATTAAELGKEYGITTDAYNAGSTPLQLEGDLITNVGCRNLPHLNRCQQGKNITYHTVVGDPVSAWNAFSNSKVKYYKPKTVNPHALSNFM